MYYVVAILCVGFAWVQSKGVLPNRTINAVDNIDKLAVAGADELVHQVLGYMDSLVNSLAENLFEGALRASHLHRNERDSRIHKNSAQLTIPYFTNLRYCAGKAFYLAIPLRTRLRPPPALRDYPIEVAMAGSPAFKGTLSEDKFKQQLATACNRRNLKLFNQLMSKAVRFGSFDRAQLAFDTMRRIGLQPNEFSYCILLTACARAGELERIEDLLAEMGRNEVPINEAVLTAVIRGYVDQFNMPCAWKYFKQLLEAEGAAPNSRAFVTLLRGCLYVGDNYAGPDQLMTYAQAYELQADPYIQNALVHVASQTFDSKRLRDVVKPGVLKVITSAQTLSDLCIAFALTNNTKRASRVLTRIEQMANEHDENEKAAKKSGKNDQKFANALSGSVRCVRDFLASTDRDDVVRHFSKDAVRRFPPLHDAVSIPEPGEAKNVTLPRLLWNAATSADHANTPGADPLRTMPSWAMPVFSTPRQVKLEVGAGLGDWVLAQAEADREFNWAAIELRSDRACLIHAKGNMRGLSNLAVLAGDAHGILQNVLPSRSVAEVVVNFPQPPLSDQTERHLVNSLFLFEAWRVMELGGTLTVTSDDEHYVASIVRRISQRDLRVRWQPCFTAPFYKTYDASDLDGSSGQVGMSVFDQIWSARGFVRRYKLSFFATVHTRVSKGRS